MRHEYLPIVSTTAFPGPCDEIVVDRYREKTVQATGVWTATCALEGSLDGLVWSPLVSPLTAGFHSVPQAVYALRIAVSVDGTRPAVLFAGFDSRSDV